VLVPSHVWCNTQIVDVARKPVAAQEHGREYSADATRCCVGFVPLYDTGYVTFFVNQDVLEVEVIVVKGKYLYCVLLGFGIDCERFG
jgi:hypothetical protein